jgi:hypothetical protein
VTLRGEGLDEVGKISIGLERGFTGNEYAMLASMDAMDDIHVGVAHEKTKKWVIHLSWSTYTDIQTRHVCCVGY